MTRTLPQVWRWRVVCLYALMLLLLSSIPGDPAGTGNASFSFFSFLPLNDKIMHFLAYFPLGWALALTGGRGWAVLAIGAGLAGLDECYQGLIPGRSPDVADWVADMAGISAGLLIEYLLKRRHRR